MNLTKFQALYIKFLRVRLEGSWRWVAARYDERYIDKIPFKGGGITFGGNQIDGMELCEAAMNYFGEEVEDGWN